MEIQTTIIETAEICEDIEGVEVRLFNIAASGRGQGAKGAVYARRYLVSFDSDQKERVIEAIATKRDALPKNTYRQVKAGYTRLMKVISLGE